MEPLSEMQLQKFKRESRFIKALHNNVKRRVDGALVANPNLKNGYYQGRISSYSQVGMADLVMDMKKWAIEINEEIDNLEEAAMEMLQEIHLSEPYNPLTEIQRLMDWFKEEAAHIKKQKGNHSETLAAEAQYKLALDAANTMIHNAANLRQDYFTRAVTKEATNGTTRNLW